MPRPEEFQSHVGSVNCLAIGHKSGKVMVTGGEDKKVNLWAVGKMSCILVGLVIKENKDLNILFAAFAIFASGSLFDPAFCLSLYR